ncbi:MAG TPA: DnaA/Hda family protein, partial [Longimicrobiales bacterium]|nr:DnaA/Hda family protein [Longimicrobiales bacterium]
DDVQFLADRHSLQEELLDAWDTITARGGQVVLASDRPPSDINGIDQRLLSRFSGGLIADIGSPDYETRVAIVNRKAIEQGQTLATGVAEAMARQAFGNVRELQGGLNKLFAIQDLDGRRVSAAEIARLFAQARDVDEFSGFLDEVADTVTHVISHTLAETRIAEQMLRWQAEGYSTRRLEAALTAPPPESELDVFLVQFESDILRLKQIEEEIGALEPQAPELARGDLFRLPDRVVDAEELLENVRERNRPLPAPPPGRSFRTLSVPDDSFAVRAARVVSEQPGAKYNPFVVYGAEGSGKTTLLAALANELLARNSSRPVAFVHGKQFAAELIHAIQYNSVASWRKRYRTAGAFVLDDIEALIGTERAQEELFHLFEDLKRSNTQMAFGSGIRPSELTDLEDRLRTRLESGLVVSITERSSDAADAIAELSGPRPKSLAPAAGRTAARETDEWFLSREKVIWNWPYAEDWLIEELE